jgi:hypothetical protein
MFNGMTMNKNYNKVALFLHQMIPHHQQAVNQAKLLMLNGEFSCPQEDLRSNEYNCVLTNLVLIIINAQNAQIQTFRMLLESYVFPKFDRCNLRKSGAKSLRGTSPYNFEDISRYSGWGGDGYRDNAGCCLEEEEKERADKEIAMKVDEGLVRHACGLGESRKKTVRCLVSHSNGLGLTSTSLFPPPPWQ